MPPLSILTQMTTTVTSKPVLVVFSGDGDGGREKEEKNKTPFSFPCPFLAHVAVSAHRACWLHDALQSVLVWVNAN